MAVTAVTITSGPTVVGRSVTLSGTLDRDGGGTNNDVNFIASNAGFVTSPVLRISDNAIALDGSGSAGSGIAWNWTGTLPEDSYTSVRAYQNSPPYNPLSSATSGFTVQLRKPLAGIWTPRRDSRGRFVPKDPTYPYPTGRVWNGTKTFFYPTSTGVYRENTNSECREGQFGHIARGVPTPYGLGIDAPTYWEWKGPDASSYNANTQSGFIVSVFSLYNAGKYIDPGNYPAVLGESRLSSNNAEALAGWWRNSVGEQSILVRNASPTFGGGDITISGIGNGLHCLVVAFTVSGGASGTRAFLNGSLVGTGPAPTYLGWMRARPYYYYSGISQSSLGIGNVHFQGEAALVNLSNDAAAALSLDPYRHFFVDAPTVNRRIGRKLLIDMYQYSRPSADVSNSGWVRVP